MVRSFSASEMTYIESSGALNSTHSLMVHSPIGWKPLTDTTDRDKPTNERTDGRTKRRVSSSVCPSLRWSL